MYSSMTAVLRRVKRGQKELTAKNSAFVLNETSRLSLKQTRIKKKNVYSVLYADNMVMQFCLIFLLQFLAVLEQQRLYNKIVTL